MAILYHVSTDLKHSGYFEPRIPSCRHQDAENDNIERVCVAPTIEDCLTAIPNGGMNLDWLNMKTRGYYLVFRIDTDKLGISPKNIISADELFKKDLVRDAEITNEYWILEPFTVPKEDSFIINLTFWDEEAHDVIPYEIYELADKEYDGDYLEAYTDKYCCNVPCCIKIVGAKYISEEAKEGDDVSFYFESDLERKAVISYLNDKCIKYDVEFDFDNELTIILQEDANLRDIFLYHYNIID